MMFLSPSYRRSLVKALEFEQVLMEAEACGVDLDLVAIHREVGQSWDPAVTPVAVARRHIVKALTRP
jgi:hypothetical protein